ncbi:MAG: peptidoglycan-binding protein [candidate division Zixibacteria bacterium]|nr:peptidoglycan-binding protein [candidate division Zixibacteria bacterium]
MAATHKVKQGESLSNIAKQYGFTDWKKIYDHPDNKEFKKKRPNPNILFPGDKIQIPEKEAKEENCSTEKRHRFQLSGRSLKLRLALKDFGSEPLANTPCELDLDGTVYELTTDGDGLIEQPITNTAEKALLRFKDPLVPFDIVIPIQIGHLDPIEEITGQKARLSNLGYYFGPVDTEEDEKFRIAVQEFQCDNDLKVDGLCGPKTQEKLKEIHGC